MTPDMVKRYARHLVLKEIGGPGQQALLSARVAIVGAGGLGGPLGVYLAAAGLGHITLIDDDIVELSNLQRQIQFTTDDIGHPKAMVMANRLRAMNPDIVVRPVIDRLNAENAVDLLGGHDLFLDGVDGFQTRFDINAASLTLKTPMLSGALGRWGGQIAGFSGTTLGPCYRCWVPDIPPDAQSCAQVGIVGALAGIIGTMMGLEVIKYVTQAGDSILCPVRPDQTIDNDAKDGHLQNGKILIYDGLTQQSRILTLRKDPQCPHCNRGERF